MATRKAPAAQATRRLPPFNGQVDPNGKTLLYVHKFLDCNQNSRALMEPAFKRDFNDKNVNDAVLHGAIELKLAAGHALQTLKDRGQLLFAHADTTVLLGGAA